MGQLVSIVRSAGATETTFGILALLMTAAASWWIFRPRSRAPRPPDVGAVSTQWLTEHRIARPDRQHLGVAGETPAAS